MLARLFLLLTLVLAASAQDRPTFEVASVKPAPNCQMSPANGPSPGRLDLPCVPIRGLIRLAYGGFTGDKLNNSAAEVVGGPSWLDTDRFAITAKAGEKVSAAVMMGPMLQTLLEERFQLKVHKEDRDKPVYVMTVSKPGKLVEAKAGSCVALDLNNFKRPEPGQPMPKYCGGMGSMQFKNGVQTANIPGTTMAEFAGRMLEGMVGRPVVDKTGLTGRYDLQFDFVPEMRGPVMLNGAPAQLPPPSGDGPNIFTALNEQLGLKLTADKAPVPVIVVDSAQKPAGN